ncbi:hypothetical protein ACLESO_25200 [Pyxidicoccus sp. 3LG]
MWSDYQMAWRALRKRTYMLVVSTIAWPAIMVAVLMIQSLGWGRLGQTGFAWLAGGVFLAIAYSSVMYGTFRCPRCHHPFFRNGLSANSFARRCLHCGLPKWADPE